MLGARGVVRKRRRLGPFGLAATRPNARRLSLWDWVGATVSEWHRYGWWSRGESNP